VIVTVVWFEDDLDPVDHEDRREAAAHALTLDEHAGSTLDSASWSGSAS